MIKIENLNYIYSRGTAQEYHALKNINLTIPDGSLLAIIGHTGSGKSTLVQHLNGLIKPTSGKIFINGIDITEKKADMKSIRREVGLVFQYPEYQLFEETVFDDIAFGAKNMGLDNISSRVEKAAEAVGLTKNDLKKSPFELSGGQKRRAAIAGVLVTEPKILILDEPAAGLDPRGRDDIFGLIKQLHKSQMTIIFVSHSMEDVSKTAERIIVMNEGKIEKTGTVSEIFSDSTTLSKTGLAIPQITVLANKLRSCGYDIPKDIYTAEQAAKAIRKLITGAGNV